MNVWKMLLLWVRISAHRRGGTNTQKECGFGRILYMTECVILSSHKIV